MIVVYMDFNTILVTGGCGAIGSEIINRLKSRYTSTMFVNVDCLTYAGNPSNIEHPFNNYTLEKGDITDVNFVSRTLMHHKPDAIFHLAAETHVDNSFGNSLRFTNTNVLGTHVLLECCKRYVESGNVLKVFVHMSTDEVYGSVSDDEPACSELALFKPSNPYAASKAGAEMICHAYIKSFNIPIVIVRCNNAISKYQHEEKLVPCVVKSLLAGIKIPIHGLGKSKRTFVHAYDIAEAFDVICQKGTIGKTYNIGSPYEYSVLDVVKKIIGLLEVNKNVDECIEFVADRAFQDYRYCIDSTELESLGWKVHVTFEEALNDMISYHVSHSTSGDSQ